MAKVLNCTGHSLLLPEIVKSDGAYLTDHRGKRYLDLESGVWCVPLGHKHDKVNRAIKRQMDALTHAGFCYSHSIVEKAADAVLSITEMPNGKCVFLCSGSEAIEVARQMCKNINGEQNTLSLHDAYLGSFGSVVERNTNWTQFDWRECATCPKQQACSLDCPKLAAIPADISEFIFEPGSASGFVRFPPAPMIRNIVEIVRNNGGQIVINEVTTGMGRTGAWFGYNHYGINPDFVAIGKGLGNGYPVSALAINQQVLGALDESFKYMQSHQNDPLGAAVAVAVIEAVTEGELVQRAADVGKQSLKALQTLQVYPQISEVRGRGMMFAVEFSDKDIGDAVYTLLIEAGFIVCNRGGTFRIDPPLILEERDFMGFIRAFGDILDGL